MTDAVKTVFLKIKKEVSLGTLLSILVPVGISILLWAISTSGTLSIHSEKIKRLEDKTKNTDQKLENKYQKIEDKIDKKIDKLDEKIDKIIQHLLK